MAQRFCRVCTGWHDLNEDWPIACGGHFGQKSGSMQIVKDIEPYKSVLTGERIAGRRQHRDHLKAHGCIEVGNEKMKPFAPNYVGGLGGDIKKAMETRRG